MAVASLIIYNDIMSMRSSMTIPHPFPYQGSKRKLAPQIIFLLPSDTNTLYEPFAGSCAITIASAHYKKAKYYVINDINKALMMLWEDIIFNPKDLIEQYSTMWYEQRGKEKEYYIKIRNEFNQNPDSSKFLYLLCRCAKAAVRYNSKGDFNQSPDNRRIGMNPIKIKKQIMSTSNLLKNKIDINNTDYENIIFKAKENDVIYMDPPYQGVSNGSNPRYFNGLDPSRFIESLEKANEYNLSYIISYDGKTGEKEYGDSLPKSLDLLRFEINAGSSSQATLLGKKVKTIESLYISSALIRRLENEADFKHKQTNLRLWV